MVHAVFFERSHRGPAVYEKYGGRFTRHPSTDFTTQEQSFSARGGEDSLDKRRPVLAVRGLEQRGACAHARVHARPVHGRLVTAQLVRRKVAHRLDVLEIFKANARALQDGVHDVELGGGVDGPDLVVVHEALHLGRVDRRAVDRRLEAHEYALRRGEQLVARFGRQLKADRRVRERRHHALEGGALVEFGDVHDRLPNDGQQHAPLGGRRYVLASVGNVLDEPHARQLIHALAATERERIAPRPIRHERAIREETAHPDRVRGVAGVHEVHKCAPDERRIRYSRQVLAERLGFPARHPEGAQGGAPRVGASLLARDRGVRSQPQVLRLVDPHEIGELGNAHQLRRQVERHRHEQRVPLAVAVAARSRRPARFRHRTQEAAHCLGHVNRVRDQLPPQLDVRTAQPPLAHLRLPAEHESRALRATVYDRVVAILKLHRDGICAGEAAIREEVARCALNCDDRSHPVPIGAGVAHEERHRPFAGIVARPFWHARPAELAPIRDVRQHRLRVVERCVPSPVHDVALTPPRDAPIGHERAERFVFGQVCERVPGLLHGCHPPHRVFPRLLPLALRLQQLPPRIVEHGAHGARALAVRERKGLDLVDAPARHEALHNLRQRVGVHRRIKCGTRGPSARAHPPEQLVLPIPLRDLRAQHIVLALRRPVPRAGLALVEVPGVVLEALERGHPGRGVFCFAHITAQSQSFIFFVSTKHRHARSPTHHHAHAHTFILTGEPGRLGATGNLLGTDSSASDHNHPRCPRGTWLLAGTHRSPLELTS